MGNDVDGKVKQIWQMLDYIAVDYAGAVENGAIISKDEYAGMVEFSQTVEKRIKELPEKSEKSGLLAAAGTLKQSSTIKAQAQPARSAPHLMKKWRK